MASFRTSIASLARIFSARASKSPIRGVAHSLMERAGAGAGRDPYQSQELRSAAQAFLSVVR